MNIEVENATLGGTLMRSARRRVIVDYRKLTNEELQILLWQLMSEMKFFCVTDETRETVIAMLTIRQRNTEEY
jgi:hypothetical protein